MLCKIVIFLTFTVYCVSSQCDQECRFRQYTRVKRGRFYSSPPIRFYNTPPMPVPVKGPFSYTPPPFMSNDVPSYPSGRPYKVSKRPPVPTNDGLGDDDISNLVKYLSKHDLDKILEFAQEKDQGRLNNKYKDVYNTNEFSRPYKRESRIVYKENVHSKYEEPAPYKEEAQFSNYVTEPSYLKVFSAHDESRPPPDDFKRSQRPPAYDDSFSPSQSVRNGVESFPYRQNYGPFSSDSPSTVNENVQEYVKVFEVQSPEETAAQMNRENYASYQAIPANAESFSSIETVSNSNGPVNFPGSNNPFYTESNEEAKLPPPVNMREEDFEASYTNNVPKIVKSESSSYAVQNFGDLPLMDYNSKLHDVSSYHVPHYTVTQPKAPKPASQISFPSSSSSYSSSSSSLLKLSPAAAAIKEPIYERAPSKDVAAEQSDAHLKAIKIWSHKSQGAAYTLHDDGTLTPERSRPKYG